MDIKIDFEFLNKQIQAADYIKSIISKGDLKSYKDEQSQVFKRIKDTLRRGTHLENNYLLNLIYKFDKVFKIVPVSDKVNYLYRGLRDNELFCNFLTKDTRMQSTKTGLDDLHMLYYYNQWINMNDPQSDDIIDILTANNTRDFPEYNSKPVPFCNLETYFYENIGNCILFKEFLSTSYNPKVARNFALGFSVILKFIIPPGYPMLAIDDVINSGIQIEEEKEEVEDEILLPRNSRFYVKSVKKIQDSKKKDFY